MTGDTALEAALERTRRELVETSTRTRMLDTPLRDDRTTSLRISGENAVAVFERLVVKGRTFRFESREAFAEHPAQPPAPDDGEPVPSIPPADASVPATGEEAEAHEAVDAQTDLDDEGADDGDDGEPTAVERIFGADAPSETAATTTAGDSEGDDESADSPTDDEPGDADSPAESDGEPPALPEWMLDASLRTHLAEDVLARRLRGLAGDARTALEEQGAQLLHLAIAFLRWQEPERKDRWRHAPLLLVPVRLERVGVSRSWRVEWTGEPLAPNLSLAERLRAECGVELPELDETDPESLDVAAWLADVDARVREQPGWRVVAQPIDGDGQTDGSTDGSTDDPTSDSTDIETTAPDHARAAHEMSLWLFSFSTYLMHRDLDPETWPAERPLADRPLVRALLGGGFDEQPEPVCDDDARVDDVLPVAEAMHVVDADSSQSIAIADVVRAGRSIVLQGPPGTGKSQTIANIIAAAIAEGRTVLFLAEKHAALDVVKRRLDRVGIGDACLELHGVKTARRTVLRELEHTLDLGRPRVADASTIVPELEAVRGELNAHADALHAPHDPSGRSIFDAIGALVDARRTLGTWPELDLDGWERWNRRDLDQRQRTLDAFLQRTDDTGLPGAHPWRGALLDGLLPTELPRIAPRIGDAEDAFGATRAIAEELAALVPSDVDAEVSPTSLGRSCDLIESLQSRPALAPAAIAAREWWEGGETTDDLLDAIATRDAADAALRETARDGATDHPISTLRLARDVLAQTGDGLGRLFSPGWWRARGVVRSIARTDPGASAERVALLDRVIARHEADERIESADALGRALFGTSWQGTRTNADLAANTKAWFDRLDAAELAKSARALLGDVARSGDESRLAAIDDAAVAAIRTRLAAACGPMRAFAADTLRLDVTEAFETASIDEVPIEQLAERLAAWRLAPERLLEWIELRTERDALRELGLAALVAALDAGVVSSEAAPAVLDAAYHERLLRLLDPAQRFVRDDGSAIERLRERFRRLDTARIRLARAQVAAAHFDRLPARDAGHGAMGLIRREIGKKRRHMPVRRLLNEAGEAIQRIKPVFMMSPLSVAQFLDPSGIEFDLLVVDEASQVRPAEALGALARISTGGRMVVVGDDKQLPPTNFFRSTLEIEDDDQPALADLESLLGACNAIAMPTRMLRWHYRSRHHSLIAVSNERFYERRLHVIPSPHDRDEQHGLRLVRVNGVFARGAGATNRIEADAIAEAVMQHARETPEVTLGVGTFSVQQREAVLDAIEERRRAHPELESFFSEGSEEPFFVKNLETIQGDERDVILVSVGYGPDADGKLSMHFGPVSNEGGERRLNVLFTRARDRCVIYSSIDAGDIDPSRATGAGPAALRAFLAAAAPDATVRTRRDGEDDRSSRFAEQVRAALQKHGHRVRERVGVSELVVDLAVEDPRDERRLLLGVDCDGPSDRDARSARDRDRTRPAVLASRGWSMHHAACGAWLRDPEAAAEGIARAAAERVRPAGETPDPGSGSGGRDRSAPFEREASDSGAASFTTPYVVCTPKLWRNATRGELASADPDRLANIVAQVVEIEGPIHETEVARRIAAAWRLARLGGRAASSIDDAIDVAETQGLVVRDGAFLDLPGRTTTPIRDRRELDRAALRKPERIAPSEFIALVRAIVTRSIAIPPTDVALAARTHLGLHATTEALRERIDAAIDVALADGSIVERDGRLTPGTNTPAD